MDPISAISLAASLISLIDGTANAIQYLNSFRYAFREHEKLCREANSLLSILTNLRQKVKEASQDGNVFEVATASQSIVGGLLDQMKDAMEHLTSKLEPSTRWRRTRIMRTWVSTKKDCVDILATIERLKSLIGLVLQQDLLSVLCAKSFSKYQLTE